VKCYWLFGLSLACSPTIEPTSQEGQGLELDSGVQLAAGSNLPVNPRWYGREAGVWHWPDTRGYDCIWQAETVQLDAGQQFAPCDTYPYTANDDGGLSEPNNSSLTCTVTPTCWSGANYGWCAYSQPCDGGDLWTCNLATPDPDLCVFVTQLDDTSAEWCCQ
jgi:hypothetical protein